MRRCKHCDKPAELKGYRDLGNLGTEITCGRCYALSNDIISLTKNKFKEGDEYWTISDGEEATIINSCWDDQSEELRSNPNYDPRTFRDKEDAVRYLYALGYDYAVLYDFRDNVKRNILLTVTT
jgi:hypothetical protein